MSAQSNTVIGKAAAQLFNLTRRREGRKETLSHSSYLKKSYPLTLTSSRFFASLASLRLRNKSCEAAFKCILRVLHPKNS